MIYSVFLMIYIPILKKNIPHPNFNIIWKNILQELNLNDCKEYFCNYWICKPILMKNFINWYLNIALPIIKKHPLIMSNAEYKYASLTSNELIKLSIIMFDCLKSYNNICISSFGFKIFPTSTSMCEIYINNNNL